MQPIIKWIWVFIFIFLINFTHTLCAIHERVLLDYSNKSTIAMENDFKRSLTRFYEEAKSTLNVEGKTMEKRFEIIPPKNARSTITTNLAHLIEDVIHDVAPSLTYDVSYGQTSVLRKDGHMVKHLEYNIKLTQTKSPSLQNTPTLDSKEYKVFIQQFTENLFKAFDNSQEDYYSTNMKVRLPRNHTRIFVAEVETRLKQYFRMKQKKFRTTFSITWKHGKASSDGYVNLEIFFDLKKTRDPSVWKPEDPISEQQYLPNPGDRFEGTEKNPRWEELMKEEFKLSYSDEESKKKGNKPGPGQVLINEGEVTDTDDRKENPKNIRPEGTAPMIDKLWVEPEHREKNEISQVDEESHPLIPALIGLTEPSVMKDHTTDPPNRRRDVYGSGSGAQSNQQLSDGNTSKQCPLCSTNKGEVHLVAEESVMAIEDDKEHQPAKKEINIQFEGVPGAIHKLLNPNGNRPVTLDVIDSSLEDTDLPDDRIEIQNNSGEDIEIQPDDYSDEDNTEEEKSAEVGRRNTPKVEDQNILSTDNLSVERPQGKRQSLVRPNYNYYYHHHHHKNAGRRKWYRRRNHGKQLGKSAFPTMDIHPDNDDSSFEQDADYLPSEQEPGRSVRRKYPTSLNRKVWQSAREWKKAQLKERKRQNRKRKYDKRKYRDYREYRNQMQMQKQAPGFISEVVIEGIGDPNWNNQQNEDTNADSTSEEEENESGDEDLDNIGRYTPKVTIPVEFGESTKKALVQQLLPLLNKKELRDAPSIRLLLKYEMSRRKMKNTQMNQILENIISDLKSIEPNSTILTPHFYPLYGSIMINLPVDMPPQSSLNLRKIVEKFPDVRKKCLVLDSNTDIPAKIQEILEYEVFMSNDDGTPEKEIPFQLCILMKKHIKEKDYFIPILNEIKHEIDRLPDMKIESYKLNTIGTDYRRLRIGISMKSHRYHNYIYKMRQERVYVPKEQTVRKNLCGSLEWTWSAY